MPNSKNYKLLNSQRDNHHEDDDEDEDLTVNEEGDLLPQNVNNRTTETMNSNEEEEEEEDDLATSSSTLFQKIKNNISLSFTRKNREEEEELHNQRPRVEDSDDGDEADYSYYTGEDRPTNNNNTTNTNEQQQQINQIPLYSINSAPAWFIRSNDPYSLENHIINHMRSNSRIEVLQQLQQQTESNNTVAGDNNSNTTGSNIFRPFSNNFLSEQHQLSEQQNNLIKDNDIIIIQQPNNRMSIGFSDSKFTNYLKNGEHNPSGFYDSFVQNDEMLQRLSRLTSGGVGATVYNNTLIGDDSSEISDFGYHLSHFELEKRKKLFFSILCIELFYYFILLSSFTSFHPLIFFFFIGLLNNLIALVSVQRQNILGLSIYLCFEIIMISINYFLDYTTLLVLRAILFMIGYKLRHEMLMFYSDSGTIRVQPSSPTTATTTPPDPYSLI